MAFIDKLDRFVALTETERQAVAACVQDERTVAAHSHLVVQGEDYDGTYVIHSGWAVRQKFLEDGRRQVVNFLITGDAIGFAATFFDQADHSVVALTDVNCSRIDSEKLMEMISTYPRVGSALFWSIALEESMLRERIVGLGQRSAREHMAHLIMEMVMRQRAGGAGDMQARRLPINQILLSDALGISPVHTNRTIRRMVLDRLIETSPQGILILDEPRLREIGDFDGQFLHEKKPTPQ